MRHGLDARPGCGMNTRPLRFAMSKQEASSWLALALCGIGSVYLALRLFTGDGAGVDGDTARHASRGLIVFVVAWLLLRRRDATPLADERDRAIAARRMQAGYMALLLMLLVGATLLGLDGWRDAIASRPAAWLESMVMLMLLASLTVHSAVGVWHYVRDRV